MADELQPFLEKARMGKGSFILAVVCAAIASLGLVDRTASLGFTLGLAIPFGLLALGFVVLGFRSPDKHAFIVALRERRNDIVWLYLLRQNVNGVHAQTFLNIGLIDGKQRALAIGKTGEEEMLAHAKALLPHATVGYSPELQAQFKRDPRSMLAR